MDSQSIKTATQATEVGFDGGKQVKGRKRHLLVDTLGLIIAVVVTAANTDDRVGLMVLLGDFLKRISRCAQPDLPISGQFGQFGVALGA